MRIAVCTDFSEYSVGAFAPAASLAKRFGADLLVLHQASSFALTSQSLHGSVFGPDYTMSTIEEQRLKLHERLEDWISSRTVFDGLNVECHVVDPPGMEVFSDALTDLCVDLVVVATHGITGVKRFFLGSFAEKLLAAAHSSVLVYRAPQEGKELDEFLPRRILVPHDLLPTSRPAFDEACFWSRKFQSRLCLHCVLEHDPGPLGCFTEIAGGWMEERERMREKATERLTKIVRGNCKGIEAQIEVSVGKPVDNIVERASTFGADLIVMAPHAKSRLRHFLLGAVTEGVARKAKCSVLVVR